MFDSLTNYLSLASNNRQLYFNIRLIPTPHKEEMNLSGIRLQVVILAFNHHTKPLNVLVTRNVPRLTPSYEKDVYMLSAFLKRSNSRLYFNSRTRGKCQHGDSTNRRIPRWICT